MNTTTALAHLDLANPNDAREVFRTALGSSRASKDALALISANPSAALVALQRGDGALGLTPKGSADVLEVAIGDLDASDARSLMNDHLTPERQMELVLGRGDLPAISAAVVDMQVILRAITDEIAGHLRSEAIELEPLPRVAVGDEEGNLIERDEDDDDDDEDSDGEEDSGFPVGYGYAMLLTLQTWAHKLKERSDFETFLEEEIGSHAIRDWLLVAIWNDAGNPLAAEDIPPGDFDELEIDPQWGQQRLSELLSGGRMPRFDAEDVAEARREHAARHKVVEEAKKVVDLTQQERDEAAKVADDLDL